METVFILIPLALLIAGIALALFIWAVASGQYDDLETPAVRILFDEDELPRRQAQRVARPGAAPEARDPGSSQTPARAVGTATTRSHSS
jgi:cbb3-type cytochrome oxidase maturation protein